MTSVEADLVEVGELLLGRLDHGLGGDPAAVLLVERRVERAAVDADADRDAAVAGLGGHDLDVLGPADVAGVEPQAVHPGLEAARARRYWWWMSATIGTGERGTIWARPSAASTSLQVQRTMSQPAPARA